MITQYSYRFVLAFLVFGHNNSPTCKRLKITPKTVDILQHHAVLKGVFLQKYFLCMLQLLAMMHKLFLSFPPILTSLSSPKVP